MALARSIFGTAVDLAPVLVRRRKFFPLQPREVAMAPCGHIHFHPAAQAYCDDFAEASPSRQGLFIHELTHVWQTQRRGLFYLPIHRHPFCRYDYSLKPGWSLERYGIEQQAEIVRHAFLLRQGISVPGVGSARAYEMLVRFPGTE